MTPQDIRSRQLPPNESMTIQGKAIGTTGLNQPETPTRKGGPAGCSTGLQQDGLTGKSVYSLTATQYAGEQTMAGVDAQKVTEGKVTYLEKEW